MASVGAWRCFLLLRPAVCRRPVSAASPRARCDRPSTRRRAMHAIDGTTVFRLLERIDISGFAEATHQLSTAADALSPMQPGVRPDISKWRLCRMCRRAASGRLSSTPEPSVIATPPRYRFWKSRCRGRAAVRPPVLPGRMKGNRRSPRTPGGGPCHRQARLALPCPRDRRPRQ